MTGIIIHKYKIGDRVICPKVSGTTFFYKVLGSMYKVGGGVEYLVSTGESNPFYINEEHLEPAPTPKPPPKLTNIVVTNGILTNEI